jgi:putative tryptophan/tyrosine transport system substrate-binding protein
VAEGIVSSLARPGGNLTGLEVLAEDLDAKRLQILKETLPKAARVAVLWNPGTPEAGMQRKVLENAAPALGVKLRLIAVQHPDEIERAFAAMVRERPDALLVSAEPMFFDAAGRIIGLAERARLPTVYFVRNFAESGGLMSYGTEFTAIYRRAATYVVKILKGAKPADLPVEQPTKFELVINLKTAKALGLTIPQSILVRADQVIQ